MKNKLLIIFFALTVSIQSVIQGEDITKECMEQVPLEKRNKAISMYRKALMVPFDKTPFAIMAVSIGVAAMGISRDCSTLFLQMAKENPSGLTTSSGAYWSNRLGSSSLIFEDDLTRRNIYVLPSLFETGAVGEGQNILVSKQRMIVPKIQDALDIIGTLPEDAEVNWKWNVWVQGGVYDEDITIPSLRNISLIGLGGVTLGAAKGVPTHYIRYPIRRCTFPICPFVQSQLQIKVLSDFSELTNSTGFSNAFSCKNILIDEESAARGEIILESVYVDEGVTSVGVDGLSYIVMQVRNSWLRDGVNMSGAELSLCKNTLFGDFSDSSIGDIVCNSIGTCNNCTFLKGFEVFDLYDSTSPVLLNCAVKGTVKKNNDEADLDVNVASNYWGTQMVFDNFTKKIEGGR